MIPANKNNEFVMEKLYSINVRHLVSYYFQEKLSFIFICLYLLFEYVRPQTIYPAINVLPYAYAIIVLTLIFVVLEKYRRNKNIVNILILIFSFVIVLSSIFAYKPEISVAHWIDFTQWLVVFFLIITIVNNEKRFFFFMLLFLLFSLKMSQHGFISWARHGFTFRDWGVTGAPGWFQNSGEFGIQLAIFIPLSIYFIVALRKYWGSVKLSFFLLMPLTAFGSVIATSSRGAMVGAGCAIIWMLLKSQHKIKTLVAIILVGVAVFAYTPEESKIRFESAGMDPTSQMRLMRWKDGVDMMNTNPILGIGYRNWMEYYPRHYYRENIGSLLPYGLPHNIFIDAGAELGYVGLGLFVLMIIFTFVNNSRTRKYAKEIGNEYIYYMAHGLDAALIGFLVSGSFVSVLYYPYFWINLAMTVSLNNIAVSEHKTKMNEV